MSVTDDLISAGELASLWDYRSGVFDDLSGSGMNLNTLSGTPQFNREGLTFNGVDETLNYDAVGISLAGRSVFGLCRRNRNTGADQYVMGTSSDGSHRFGFGFNAAGEFHVNMWNGAAYLSKRSNAVLAKGVWYFFYVYFKDMTTTPELYIDGVEQSGGTGTFNLSTPGLIIGSRVGVLSFLDGSIATIGVIDRPLTSTEIVQLMGETRHNPWPTKTRARVASTKLPGIDGLTAAWLMKPQGGTVPNLGPSANDGVISGNLIHGKHPVGSALTFRANDESINCGNAALTGASFSVAMCFLAHGRGEANFGRFVEQGYSRCLIHVSNSDTNLTFRYYGSAGNSVRSLNNGYIQNHWSILVLAYDAATTTISWYLNNVLVDSWSDTFTWTTSHPLAIGNASTGSRAFDGEIAYVQNYDHALTAGERGLLQDGMASAIQYASAWGTPVSDAAVASGQLEKTGFEVGAGSFKVSTDTIDGERVKVIECVTAGSVSINMNQFMTPTETAYGTWEWKFYKGTTSSTLYFYFVSSHPLLSDPIDGYRVVIDSTERVDFRRTVGGGTAILMQSAAAVVTIGAWHTMKITRSAKGKFFLYLDGVLITPALGSNPVTNTTNAIGKYFLADIDTADKIAFSGLGGHAIVKQLGVV